MPMQYLPIPSTTASATQYSVMPMRKFLDEAMPLEGAAEFLRHISDHFVVVGGTSAGGGLKVMYLGEPLGLVAITKFARHAQHLFRRVFDRNIPPLLFDVGGVKCRLGKSAALEYWAHGPHELTGRRSFWPFHDDDSPELVAAIAEWHSKFGGVAKND